MSFKIKKGVWCEDFPDTIELPVVTTAVTVAETLVAYGTAGVVGAVTAADPLTTIAGIAQATAAIGANALVTPLLAGMLVETQYSAGAPAIGDAVEIVDNAEVRILTAPNTIFIGRVVKVLNATDAAVIDYTVGNGVSIPARTCIVRIV